MKFIETIKYQNGEFTDLPLHVQRFYDTQKLRLGSVFCEFPDLAGVVSKTVTGAQKVRIVYGEKLELVEALPYAPRKISSLKIVECEAFDYSSKFADRKKIDKLFAMRGACDDIIICVDGFVCDTSFSNIVFIDGARRITPETFLLDGTKRRALLRRGLVAAEPVAVSDIRDFDGAILINAMLGLSDSEPVDVSRIF